ncbi:MAG TPA: hypothetical protein VMF90_11150 [Rhizobiaceae bacterium]|nr:hypothetical protein [Rhizobiaceae bacterium]
MRIAYGFVAAAVFAAGEAQASSFLVLPAVDTKLTQSMVAIPALPAGVETADIVYPSETEIASGTDSSLIALGEPPVTDEKVAAIEEKRSGPASTPMVIRGGVVGDTFAPAEAAAPLEPTAPAEATAPADEMPEPQTASAPAEPLPVKEPAVSEGAAAPAPTEASTRDPE